MPKKYDSGFTMYTFSEIITALREDYLETANMVSQLQNLIRVNCNIKTKIKLFLSHQKDYFCENDVHFDGDVILRLIVYKNNFSIPRYFRVINGKHNNFSDIYDIAHYEIIEENENIKIKFTGNYFSPEVQITDMDMFKKIYDKLMETKQAKVFASKVSINSYETIYFENHSIFLCCSEYPTKHISISYDAFEDIINVESPNYLYPDDLEAYLDTKVPSYLISPEYNEFISSNLNKIKSIHSVSEMLKKASYNINESDNGYFLTRKYKKQH